MTVLVLLTGERHGIAPGERGRVVTTGCGLTVALTADRPDPTSVYQRAVFPKAFHPTRCARCPR